MNNSKARGVFFIYGYFLCAELEINISIGNRMLEYFKLPHIQLECCILLTHGGVFRNDFLLAPPVSLFRTKLNPPPPLPSQILDA